MADVCMVLEASINETVALIIMPRSLMQCLVYGFLGWPVAIIRRCFSLIPLN